MTRERRIRVDECASKNRGRQGRPVCGFDALHVQRSALNGRSRSWSEQNVPSPKRQACRSRVMADLGHALDSSLLTRTSQLSLLWIIRAHSTSTFWRLISVPTSHGRLRTRETAQHMTLREVVHDSDSACDTCRTYTTSLDWAMNLQVANLASPTVQHAMHSATYWRAWVSFESEPDGFR
jgi:hypothetical protein